jgi:hypothetical protein
MEVERVARKTIPERVIEQGIIRRSILLEFRSMFIAIVQV